MFCFEETFVQKKGDSSDRLVNLKLGRSDRGNLTKSNKQVLVRTKPPKSLDNATKASDNFSSKKESSMVRKDIVESISHSGSE